MEIMKGLDPPWERTKTSVEFGEQTMSSLLSESLDSTISDRS